MKSEFVYFSKEAVIAFLGNHGKPETKDYEFAAALIIHRFCEKQWGNDWWIGFRIRPEYSNSLPAYNSEQQVGLEEIAKLFSKGVDEDSPVDFVIAKRANMNKAQGMVFQVKRFGIGRDKKDTDELVAYLNSFSKKYGKTDANLLICLDDWVKIDMEKLHAGLDTTNFPFNRILFTWIVEGMVHIRNVYPRGETEQYPITDLFLKS
jgi:hypothetical protein